MKPLPAQHSAPTPPGGGVPSVPPAIEAPATYSVANRRSSIGEVQKTYSWLLLASTTVAGVFCVLYITKPVVTTFAPPTPAVRISSAAPALPSVSSAPLPAASLMPDGNRLPGEKNPASKPTSPLAAQTRGTAPLTPIFEETNLRIQHVLTAEAPGRQVARIDLDVPVLYQSRHLRWTPTEVAEARSLLNRLTDYQEKSRILRAEGVELLETWNRLVERSIPAADLRADSPTLPVNQLDSTDLPRPAGLSTTDSIQIQPAGK